MTSQDTTQVDLNTVLAQTIEEEYSIAQTQSADEQISHENHENLPKNEPTDHDDSLEATITSRMCAVGIELNAANNTPKKFQSHERSNVKRHERTVHGKIKNYVCGKCGRAFKLKHQLQNHFAKLHFKHGKLKEKLYESSNQSIDEQDNSQSTCNVESKSASTEEAKSRLLIVPEFILSGEDVKTHVIPDSNICVEDTEKRLEGSVDLKEDFVDDELDKCEEDFANDDNLRRHHYKMVKESQEIKCPDCGKTFSRKDHMNSHKLLVHSYLSRYKCEKCGSFFRQEQHLKRHCDEVHEGRNKLNRYRVKEEMEGIEIVENDYVLKGAKEVIVAEDLDPDEDLKKIYELEKVDPKDELSGQNDNLEESVLNKSEKTAKQFLCEKCPYQSSKKANLELHEQRMHNEKFVCTECGSTFPQKRLLKKHVDSIHLGIKKFKCEKCPFESTKGNVKIHFNNVHEKLKDFVCEECGSAFSAKQRLTRHGKTVHKTKDHVCEECGSTFSKRAYLFSHMNTAHSIVKNAKKCKTENFLVKITRGGAQISKNYGKNSEGKFICEKCPYQSIRRENLVRHERTMHNENFVCKECGASFPQKSSLKRHVDSIHLSKNIFKCDKCPYESTSKSSVRIHNGIVHDKVKEHVCEECGHAFPLIHLLDCHKRKIHKKANFLTCEECGSSFSQRAELRNHLQTTHLRKRIFKCDMEPPESSYKSNLKKHNQEEDRNDNLNIVLGMKVEKEDTVVDFVSEEYDKYDDHVVASTKLHEYDHEEVDFHLKDICNEEFDQMEDVKKHEEADHFENLENDDGIKKDQEETDAELVCDELDKHEKHFASGAKLVKYCHEEVEIHLEELCMEESNFKEEIKEHEKSGHDNLVEHHRRKEQQKETDEDFDPERCLENKIDCDKNDNTENVVQITRDMEEKFACDKCSYQSSRKANLERHERTNHNKNYPCEKCGAAFPQNSSLKKHVDSIHLGIKKFKCEKCPYESSNKARIKMHNNSVHDKLRGYVCKECGSAFSMSHQLDRHERTVHNKVKHHVCRECGSSFSLRSDLRSHVHATHLKTRNFKCDKCPSQYTYKVNLTRHRRIIHNETKNYDCEDCGSSFMLKCHLKQHMDSVHLKNKKYPCDICPYESTNKNIVKYHIRNVHDKVKDHICEQCGAAFPTNQHLKRHKRMVHEKIRDHICEECGRHFSDNGALKAHRNAVHLKIRDFVCKDCGVSFARKIGLKMHEKTIHMKIKDQICMKCGMTYTTKGHLSRHEKICPLKKPQKSRVDKWIDKLEKVVI